MLQSIEASAMQEGRMTTAMAQHLLLAADRYQLIRLRTMCEKRLCDSVDVETVATTLMLADKSNAENLRKVCANCVSCSQHRDFHFCCFSSAGYLATRSHARRRRGTLCACQRCVWKVRPEGFSWCRYA